ncbi:hydrolase CocE/NonD family protein (plasmid) [Gemmatirosa kalamazoonensis]|uniref:Hydrolase CocE/NonD family protein n=1 Tax=Gemmatirosa kalamazoonensis TaxID=861299 RepID=W0RT21_9BACT|nr:CocE/NonD family hydrolase [Gemmatirosa kalamazoonensis]AHG93622.1 hydrolase CocE/NonD family protein [Gemmatirosa kalamazoonensis]
MNLLTVLRVRRLLPLLLVASRLAAQAPTAQDSVRMASYEPREVMIPMRDGVRLHTLIFTPKSQTGDLPIILNRTPYGIAGARASFGGSIAELADEGYVFVFQDIRGRFTSEGQFVMLRPPMHRKDPKAIDESTDTYDTIDWLLKNVPRNNGRVGMLGVSYPGWLTVMAMLDPHPALKAVSPQASPASMFLGDDFHHNGAFRLAYGFEYAAMMEGGKELTPFQFDKADAYSWYLGLGSLATVNDSVFKRSRPTWNDFAAHPNFDAFWQREALMQYLDRVTVPTLNVAGWWDQEDFYGPIKIYETLEPHDTKHLNYLVVGPWNHGGWRGRSGQTLGPLDFGSPTAKYYREKIEAPWFAYWLKDKGTLDLAEATTFEAGANAWRRHDAWPPKTNVTSRRLYFQANGKLGFEPPRDTGRVFDAYVSDPNKPVPYRARPIKPTFGAGSTWSTWLVDDQRFVQDRPDVAAWESAPLPEDLVLSGDVVAKLFAATTGTDADWVVKLIDVYPEDDAKLGGYQLMVANDVFRGRFRSSFEHPQAIAPDVPQEYTIDLHTQSYRFLKGHRLRVQVQSTWFPLIDRNPQTFVPNIFAAKDADFRAATQRVFRSKGAASYVQLTVQNPPLVP